MKRPLANPATKSRTACVSSLASISCRNSLTSPSPSSSVPSKATSPSSAAMAAASSSPSPLSAAFTITGASRTNQNPATANSSVLGKQFGESSLQIVPILKSQAQALRSLGRAQEAAAVDQRVKTIQASAMNQN